MKINGLYKEVDTDYLYFCWSGGLTVDTSFSTSGWNLVAIRRLPHAKTEQWSFCAWTIFLPAHLPRNMQFFRAKKTVYSTRSTVLNDRSFLVFASHMPLRSFAQRTVQTTTRRVPARGSTPSPTTLLRVASWTISPFFRFPSRRLSF